ncbi:bifunctional diaminohydroxyphosphoribosylaminopyrimidine deaminase/5-amino-6-(5-phosphoribosylamino)uracil reductase RibD [Propionibacterium freudenreichii]|uniref:bifunctional diaminohydroxyphosphoribosylaminopyrimidine deaminase/5-amino-6-(5-phosphoribosylamino)uracil reductase RibD n=1 Tax=Propionibacterium freudenreichii TaxID=1744 RepID=UPI00054313EE|nr:bifunctional diaminohydroxyphosphoribosylaminopyrimidine deaminase/5-amino-6-(5-phosphoribosylamino)uracil reductase RibD [Propionibacterium freudenreichii]CEH01157.1 Riboflavin-specific deaminase (diaminohydroxyphosphoribosylaminopyrimidine deaminase) (5-amino-6-(5-phosphoribosylamino)uracil reductase) [Propionibacterium freudenreichii]
MDGHRPGNDSGRKGLRRDASASPFAPTSSPFHGGRIDANRGAAPRDAIRPSTTEAGTPTARPTGTGTPTSGASTASGALPHELTAMHRAFELSARGPAADPNPRVGCVLITSAGEVIAEGWHRGAGTSHAEVAALAAARRAGRDVRGATAVVSLEPCAHWGRTGPCAVALADAGIARVVFSVPDPNPVAAGGAQVLRQRGVEVIGGVEEESGRKALGDWLARQTSSLASGVEARPHVIVKMAATLDGRVAASDGTSRWITGADARGHAHRLRSRVGAIVVGTGTLLADDPALTARLPDGSLAEHQPWRVVMGMRPIPDHAAVRGPGGELLALRTHDPAEVIRELSSRGVNEVLIEGGPIIASAFLAAGLVSELHAYIAPALLGAGAHAISELGIGTIAETMRFHIIDVQRLGDDLLVIAQPRPPD